MKTPKAIQAHSGLALILALPLPASLSAISVKFTSSGSFIPPGGVTNVMVDCWGGGAGGSAQRISGATVEAGGGRQSSGISSRANF